MLTPSTVRTQPRTLTRRRSLCLIAALALLPGLPAFAAGTSPKTPHLVAAINGRDFDRFVVKDEVLTVLDSAGHAVEGRRSWRIDGDARAAADYFGFVTRYSIRRRDLLLGPADPNRPFVADLFLDVGSAGSTWSDESMRNGLVVFGWVVDGVISRVATVALARNKAEWRNAATVIDLTEAEARGAPVVLLWGQSGFEPVKIKYDRSLHAALAAMLFRSKPETREVIMQLAERDLRRNAAQDSLLHAAAGGGFLDAVRALRERGVPGDLSSGELRPIEEAAANGRTDVVAELASLALSERRSPPAATESAIRRAARNGHLDIAATLIDRFNGWKKWPLAADALADGAALHGREDLLRQLVENGKSNAIRNVSVRSLLTRIQARDRSCLAFLLEHGADVRDDHHESTPLHSAAREGLHDIAAMIIAQRASIDAVDSAGRTPLMLAARNGHLDTARLLLEHKANAARADKEGFTALHFAIMGGSHDTAAEIIRRQSKLAEHRVRGATPLDLALTLRSDGCVELLTRLSCPFSVTHPASIEGAVILDRIELLERAVQAGWDPAMPAAPGWTWASVAAHARAQGALAWLTARGVTPDPGRAADSAIDENGQTLPWVTTWFAGGLPQRATPITARVRLVAEADGQLRFPVILSEAPEAAPAIMTALAKAPGVGSGHEGEPTTGPAIILCRIPASDRRVYAIDEVDQPPTPLEAGSLLPRSSLRSEPTRHQSISTGKVGPFDSTYTISEQHIELADGALQEAWVAVVVEPDGSIGPFEVLRDNTTLGDETLVEDLHFRPGLRDGTPVRVRFVVRISSSRS